jgi:prepilin-type N-terminal cleavage/methylation domain-containing protein
MCFTKYSLKTKRTFQKGFTLVELLIVTVILVVLAGAVLLAIDPTKKIKAAKDTTVKSDMGQLINALQAYYTNPNNGNMYPLTAVGLGGLIPNELKSLPQQQTGTAPCPTTPDGTTSNTNYCYVVDTTGKQAAVWGTLFSTGTAVWCWDSTSGAFRTEILATTIPTQASPICPLAAATPTPTTTLTLTPTPTNCPAAGICQTGGGSSCAPIQNLPAGTADSRCPFSAVSCSGDDLMGQDGKCDGNGN